MAFIRCSGGGGSLKIKRDTVTITANAEQTINVGFKPTSIVINTNGSSNYMFMCYDESITDYPIKRGNSSGSANYITKGANPNTATNLLRSVTDTGFTIQFTGTTWGTKFTYVAVGS